VRSFRNWNAPFEYDRLNPGASIAGLSPPAGSVAGAIATKHPHSFVPSPHVPAVVKGARAPSQVWLLRHAAMQVAPAQLVVAAKRPGCGSFRLKQLPARLHSPHPTTFAGSPGLHPTSGALAQ
jgi:hypothetical protein